MVRKNLLRSTLTGIVWQGLGGGGQAMIRLCASTILTRLLAPSDFGLFGMALLVREFITYAGNIGMGAGLIAKKDITQDDVSTCYWAMLALNLVLFCIGYLSGPLAGAFFNEPKVVWVVRAVSLTFLFSSIGFLPRVLLQKDLRFDTISVIQFAGILMESAIAVLLVFFWQKSYWALVTAMLISGLFTEVAFFVRAGWLPKCRFHKDSFRYFFRFGLNIQGYSIVNYLHQNIDYILVSKLLGPHLLGLYEFAYRIPHTLHEKLALPLGNVVFPAFSEIQDSDERLASSCAKTAKYISLVAFPALGGFAVLAEPLVYLLWGEKWLVICDPLRVLCACAAVRCVMIPVGPVIKCKKRPDLLFKFGLVRLLFTFVMVYALGQKFSILGVAWGMMISTLPEVVMVILMSRMLSASSVSMLKALVMPFTATVLCMAAAFFSYTYAVSIEMNDAMPILAGVLSGVIVYVLSVRVLFHDAFTEIVHTVKLLVNKAA